MRWRFIYSGLWVHTFHHIRELVKHTMVDPALSYWHYLQWPCCFSYNLTVPLALLYTPWSLWEIIGSICCWLCAVFLVMTCWFTYPEFNPLCYAWVCKYVRLSMGECGGTSLGLGPLCCASSNRARTAGVLRNHPFVTMLQLLACTFEK